MTAATNPRNVRTLRTHALVAELMAEISKIGVAQRIAQARGEAGLTQAELADIMNVHPRTVQNWESQTNPRMEFNRLDELGGVLATTKFWLLHGAELPGSAEDAATLAEILRRLGALEEQVEAQGKATTTSVDALARDLRALTLRLAPEDGRATKAATR